MPIPRHLRHPGVVGPRQHDVVVEVALDEQEWRLLRQHFQWLGPARISDQKAVVIGYDDAEDFRRDVDRLVSLVQTRSPMPPRDWRRLLISVELLFGSSVLGCGLDWSTVSGISDEDSAMTLRALQRKLVGVVHRRSEAR